MKASTLFFIKEIERNLFLQSFNKYGGANAPIFLIRTYELTH